MMRMTAIEVADLQCFGLALERARTRKGWSRADLARAMGWSVRRAVRRIAAYERYATDPPPDDKRRLVRLLGVTPADAEWAVEELARLRAAHPGAPTPSPEGATDAEA